MLWSIAYVHKPWIEGSTSKAIYGTNQSNSIVTGVATAATGSTNTVLQFVESSFLKGMMIFSVPIVLYLLLFHGGTPSMSTHAHQIIF